MPTALPEHVRPATSPRPSPDLLRDNRDCGSNTSNIFLPSSVYKSAAATKTYLHADLSIYAGTTPAESLLHSHEPSEYASAEPDDFYKQYNYNVAPYPPKDSSTDFDDPPSTSRHARARSRGSSTSSRTAAILEYGSTPKQDPVTRQGLKTRKASVKNLVAQINATSTEELPPVPSLSYSTTNSQAPSPILTTAQLQSSNQRRPSSSNAFHVSSDSFDTRYAPTRLAKPLFGEFIPSMDTLGSPGYGIADRRQRRGSEGSPIHSRSPTFPAEDIEHAQATLTSASQSSPRGYRSDRRRTNSDLPTTFSQLRAMKGLPPVAARLSGSASASHIPVASRTSVVYSTRGDESQFGRSQDQIPVRKITSPGRSGKNANGTSPGKFTQRNKSPMLNARIIAPPPKISPTLRSSRPRVPVSSASTAASRARMVEKFNAMQRLNNERRSTQRRPAKPPELVEVDFDARRLKITQALTRSRESEQMKASFQTGRKWEPRRSESPAVEEQFEAKQPRDMPVVRYAQGDQDLQEETAGTDSPVDLDHKHLATQTALNALQGSLSDSAEYTKPHSFGRVYRAFGDRPVPLKTEFLRLHDPAEPVSAVTDVTVDTEATHIDPEPQVEDHETPEPSQTLLDQVMRIRGDHGSLLTDLSSDRGDVMSVNLIMRNTAYMDEDEAAKKGYHDHLAPHGTLDQPEEDGESQRDSWTSSIQHDGFQDDSDVEDDSINEATAKIDPPHTTTSGEDDTYRTTTASDAYTIVNIVLQRYSSAGIVDQQFVDDVYHKMAEVMPSCEQNGAYDYERIEQLCLEEMERRGDNNNNNEETSLRQVGSNKRDESVNDSGMMTDEREQSPADKEMYLEHHSAEMLTLPSTTYQGHRYRPSLDSAEDWAETSPSIGDWMRFASDQRSPPVDSTDDGNKFDTSLRDETSHTNPFQSHEKQALGRPMHTEVPFTPTVDLDDEQVSPEEYGVAIITAPSRSPQPPPKDVSPGLGDMYAKSGASSADLASLKPKVPDRVASLAQTRTASHAGSRPPSLRSRSGVAPGEVPSQAGELASPEMRKLKQRRHVLKELVDTEFTYSRDMRVLCDIYKQTAPNALAEEDVKLIFGNVEQVQAFARDFMVALKQAARPTYSMDKNGLLHSNTSVSTLASTSTKADSSEVEMQADRETRVGRAFETVLRTIELVYLEYIRNRHGANQHLEELQKSKATREWLRECKENSSDITNAWNLDALLVKPVQRITKYPLLLKELIDSTAPDHPDMPALKRAFNSVTEINMRINDHKKHTELVDQVLSRKRGQSDANLRLGLSKAFGRRAEKLKQHVGITDMYEDSEYNDLRVEFDNNVVHLIVVTNDCQMYEKGMTQWIGKMVELAGAGEAWIDVGQTSHQQLESKIRHFGQTVRNIHNIALPDHVEHLQRKVIGPMQKAADMLTKFKDEPKGLMAKRDKRLVDYAQMKNRKDRGERLDRKLSERMDQWEALNTEAKERMRKLLRATAHLVQSCLGHLVQIQMSWMTMLQQKLSNVMSIPLHRLSPAEIERDWQVDADFQEASALSLGICNGSLASTAANMTTFAPPGSLILNGNDSPRQLSWASANKRSISLNSDSSTVPMLDFAPRPNITYTQPLPESHFDRPYPYPNSRTRAASTTSGRSFAGMPVNVKSANTMAKHTSASGNFARPTTSPGIGTDLSFAVAPRLSVEIRSPLMSSFPTQLMQPPKERPVSSNTFYSASPGPSHDPPSHRSGTSSVFSSAMPMSDSPMLGRPSMESAVNDPTVLFAAASMYEFNIDRARREAGFPYLTYVTGEIFDVIAEKGELWLAKNQDDPQKQIGWIWNKHFCKLAA